MTCPICGGKTVRAYRPFCSGRCADIDLGKWLNGAYSVPSRNPEDVENALEEAQRVSDGAEKPPRTRH